MKEQEYFNVADIFGENVFNDSVMRERLPKKTYQKMKEVISQGRELDPETADVVAHEMKEWAIEKGATHYTYEFFRQGTHQGRTGCFFIPVRRSACNV